MADLTRCTRHPAVETGLRCVSCETPICPRCARDAPIGMRCPSCAKPASGGGLRRRPDQIGRAAAVAVAGALVGGLALGLIAGVVRFFGLFLAYLVGLQIGQRVRVAANGNTVDVVRALAVAGGVGAGLLTEVVVAVVYGGPAGLSVYTVLRAGIAGWAAWSQLR